MAVAPSNRQAWSALAGARLRAGDEPGALEAMARADALGGSGSAGAGGDGDEPAR